MRARFLVSTFFLLMSLHSSGYAAADAPTVLQIVQSLETGKPVKIVCFGDSITGIYYHSGGRRAWSHALDRALRDIYPQSRFEMINAGISGNTTANGLERIEKDVLQHRPQLVAIMFGMNDVARTTAEDYRANLLEIVQRIRAVGSEIVLMTPNFIYDEDPLRPLSKLREYAQIMRDVAREQNVPLADAFQIYEEIFQTNQAEWIRLMSETIHPNMRGHRQFAAAAASVISGRKISPPELTPLVPALPHVTPLIKAGKTVRISAMRPFDTLIETAIRQQYPDAKLEIKSWDPSGKTIVELADLAKKNGWFHYREHPELPKPDLTIVAVPFEAGGDLGEEHYRSYSWVLNWAQSFMPPPREDCLIILPSVLRPAANAAEVANENFALEVIADKDLPYLTRAQGDENESSQLLARELERLFSE